MGEFSYCVEPAEDNRADLRIRLSGSITACNVDRVLLRLTEVFDRADSILLDFSEVRELDLAGLKLFCSCHRNLLFSGKLLRIAGLSRFVLRGEEGADDQRRRGGCGIDWHHGCIWLVGA